MAGTFVNAGAAPSREERWKQEAGFFDDVAQKQGESALVVDPLALRRYTRPVLRRRFSLENRLRLLGSLQGKTVLDVGCGAGLNTALLARLGARVTGIDVSPGALALARKRADASGVGDRVSFVCAPVERAALPDRSFDVVWGDGILHHVLDDLELVVRRLAGWAGPGGLLMFCEPVNLCPALRRFRGLIPVHTDATPGERPMLRSELELVRRYVPDLTIRHYSLLGRLDRFVLERFNYERSSFLRRTLVNGIDALDWLLLSLPLVRDLAGTCVLYGHPGRSSSRALRRTPTPRAFITMPCNFGLA